MCLRVNTSTGATAFGTVVELDMNLLTLLENLVGDNPELALPSVRLSTVRSNFHTTAAVLTNTVGNLIDRSTGILLLGEVCGIVTLHVTIVDQADKEGSGTCSLQADNLQRFQGVDTYELTRLQENELSTLSLCRRELDSELILTSDKVNDTFLDSTAPVTDLEVQDTITGSLHVNRHLILLSSLESQTSASMILQIVPRIDRSVGGYLQTTIHGDVRHCRATTPTVVVSSTGGIVDSGHLFLDHRIRINLDRFVGKQ